ncbi:MAG: hypothetical protein WC539_09955 [Nitrospirota bacterium]
MEDKGHACLQEKEVGKFQFFGLIFGIFFAIIIFDIILGLVFHGFTKENSTATQDALIHTLYFCFGAAAAIPLYHYKKNLIIILSSGCLVVGLQLLILSAGKTVSLWPLLQTVFLEKIWAYGALLVFIQVFRYAEMNMDYAQAENIVETIDEATNKKLDMARCSKCGGRTVVAREWNIRGTKKQVFFCECCGRYIKGNPLTGLVLGVVLIVTSIGLAYGMNAGSGRSPSDDAINILFVAMFALGIRSLYMGIRSVFRQKTSSHVLPN